MYSWQTTWEDYYKILKIKRPATAEEIEKAWKLRLLRIHPDTQDEELQSAANELAKKVNVAHDVLSHPVEKLDYDREYDRRHSGSASSTGSRTSSSGTSTGKPGGSTGDSAGTGRTSGKSSGSTGSTSGSSAPPKDNGPILAISPTDILVEEEEGKTATVNFIISHVSGNLPPDWEIVSASSKGGFLKDFSFSISSINAPRTFPVKVTVKFPVGMVGEFEDFLEFVLIP